MMKAQLFHNGHSHQYHFDGGYISTNESLQPYKFEGKVLAAIEKIDNLRREDEPLGEGKDRTFGLDNYDIEARQYFAMAPMWDRVDPLAEKYYGISPYAYCGGNPVNRGDYDGDSITILGGVAEFISMIYNALPLGTNINLKVDNGVIDPNSIPDLEDPFFADFKYVASHTQMIDVAFADGYDYLDKDDNLTHVNFDMPIDTDDLMDLGNDQYNNLKARGVEVGKSMIGNTGVSLFALGNAQGTKPVGGRNLLLINGKGSLNHRSIGFAHELIHFSQYLKGNPYAHPQIDDYLYSRMKTLILRLGYDY